MEYTVEIKWDQPFDNSKEKIIGTVLNRKATAIVSYEGGGSVEYGYLEKEELYQSIRNGEEINLNKTYIKDFSYQECCKDIAYEMIFFSAEGAFFDGNTSFANAQFGNEDVIFDLAQFGNGNVSFNHSEYGKGKISFDGASFGNGKVSFYDAQFGDGDVSFEKTNFGKTDIIFSEAQFGNGRVSFDNAKFQGNVYYVAVNFGDGNVSFMGTKFDDGNIIFAGSIFGSGNVSFFQASFGEGKIDFKHVNFGDGNVFFDAINFGQGDTSFMYTQFGKGDVSFKYTQFGDGTISFNNTQFGEGDISFHMSFANTISFTGCKFSGNEDFRFRNCNSLRLINCIILNSLDMKRTEDIPTLIKELYLINTRNSGQIYIDWEKNNVRDIIRKQKDTSWSQKADQFVILKENFRNLGQHNDEDKAYYEFKQCQGKSLLHNEAGKKGIITRTINFFRWFFTYGTQPLVVGGIMFIVIALFAGIYYAFPCLLKQSDELNRVWNAIQHSIITFFTIGYGNTLPIHWIGVLLCGIEGFLGVFLMAYFVGAVVKRTLR